AWRQAVSDRLVRLLSKLGTRTAPQGDKERRLVMRRLTLAGHRRPAALEIFYGLRILLMLVGGALFLLWQMVSGGGYPHALLLVFIPLAVGYYMPLWLLQWQAQRRRRQIFRELPDVLDLLLICIEAGLSFDMSLYRISQSLRGMAPLMSCELQQYAGEIQSGLPREQVLHGMAVRNDSPSLQGVVNVLLQSWRFGTDIGEALRVYIHSMRTERRQSAEEKGAKISTRLTFPLVILILPALFIVILGPALINLLERLQSGF
nr:type II secretion system F family protein [Desulfobacterales bacterium]